MAETNGTTVIRQIGERVAGWAVAMLVLVFSGLVGWNLVATSYAQADIRAQETALIAQKAALETDRAAARERADVLKAELVLFRSETKESFREVTAKLERLSDAVSRK